MLILISHKLRVVSKSYRDMHCSWTNNISSRWVLISRVLSAAKAEASLKTSSEQRRGVLANTFIQIGHQISILTDRRRLNEQTKDLVWTAAPIEGSFRSLYVGGKSVYIWWLVNDVYSELMHSLGALREDWGCLCAPSISSSIVAQPETPSLDKRSAWCIALPRHVRQIERLNESYCEIIGSSGMW